MYKNLNTDPDKKPRLRGQLGDLSHTKVSSSEFRYMKDTEIFGQAAPAGLAELDRSNLRSTTPRGAE